MTKEERLKTYDIEHEIDAELLYEGALATGDSEDEAEVGVFLALRAFAEDNSGKVVHVTYRAEKDEVFGPKAGERGTVSGRLGVVNLPTEGIHVKRNRREHNPRHIPYGRVLSIYVLTDDDVREQFKVGTRVAVFKYGSDYHGNVVEVKKTRALVEFETLGGSVKRQAFSMFGGYHADMWPSNGFKVIA